MSCLVGFDRDRLEDTLMALGEALTQDSHLCPVGCVPGIFFGQPERTTQVIEVWEPLSSFEREDLERGCERAGLLCDPNGDVGSDAGFLRLLRPGLAAYPTSFELQEMETYRRLKLTTPTIPLLVAGALARASPLEIEAFVFWMGERRLKLREIEQAVEELAAGYREAAGENLVLARLVAIDGPA